MNVEEPAVPDCLACLCTFCLLRICAFTDVACIRKDMQKYCKELQSHLGQACLGCLSKLSLACRYGVRKALVHKWPLRRLRHEIDKQRSAAGVCMECRQKLHILCVRARCRECCQRRQLTEDCAPHSSDAAKTRKAKLTKTKARKKRSQVINADTIMVSGE